MRNITLTSLLCFLLLAGGAATANAQERNFSFAFTFVGLELPAGLTTTITPYGEDDIYNVAHDGKTLMQFYVGNHPLDTVFKEHQQYVTSGYFSGQPEKTIVYDYPDGTQSRETIVSLAGGQSWPRYVHAWYVNLQAGDAALADRIIATIGPSLPGTFSTSSASPSKHTQKR